MTNTEKKIVDYLIYQANPKNKDEVCWMLPRISKSVVPDCKSKK